MNQSGGCRAREKYLDLQSVLEDVVDILGTPPKYTLARVPILQVL